MVLSRIKRYIAANNAKIVRASSFNQRKYLLEQNILQSDKSGISSEKYAKERFIVSLTTYSKRIYDVHLTIESIMEQTMKANRIILWLDYSFENIVLPKALYLLQERGLEIKFCADLRSYKKLIPTLRECPNDVVITIDDDAIYEFDVLEKLILAYKEDPSYIYCNHQHKMLLDKNGFLLPYKKWAAQYNGLELDIMNFPVGVGGILYPPQSLDEEVFNDNVFMDICKYADDVWFKAMALKKGTLSKKVFTHDPRGIDFVINDNVQDIALTRINVDGASLNDKQIKAVFTKYKLFDKIGSHFIG